MEEEVFTTLGNVANPLDFKIELCRLVFLKCLAGLSSSRVKVNNILILIFFSDSNHNFPPSIGVGKMLAQLPL